MQPAFSVIIFTVCSGAGYGLIALTVLLALSDGVTGNAILSAGLTALVLITIGLLASTRHLANPRNAWRAFSRFRSSWLSREAIFAVAFYPFAVLYIAIAGGLGLSGWPVAAAAVLTAVLALATVFCTGMIYACLRTIRQWHSPLVPLNYLLLGLASGSLLLSLILALHGSPVVAAAGHLSLGLVAVAALVKLVYYYWIGQPQGSTINTAVGITRAQVRLFDSGQSSSNFLNREFGFQASAGLIRMLRSAVLVLAFALPLLLLALSQATAALTLAVLAALVGTGIERWLFFAEARHVVNLFYGAPRT